MKDSQIIDNQQLREVNEQAARDFQYQLAEKLNETPYGMDWVNQNKEVVNGLFQYQMFFES